jgi:hypothetical protein
MPDYGGNMDYPMSPTSLRTQYQHEMLKRSMAIELSMQGYRVRYPDEQANNKPLQGS